MLGQERVRAVRGPVGSGKSTAMVIEIFRRACQQKVGKDGMRRTRFAVVRNTLGQLRTTCLETIQTVLGPLVTWHPSKNELHIEFDDVRSVWLLLPLDTPQNVQRLLSLELTGAWISEFREIPVSLAHDVYSRCGRFPSAMNGGADWYGMVMETNSFTEDSGWFEQLEVDLPANWGYYVQPPGITEYDDGSFEATGENVENLPETYYTDQMDSNGGIDSEWCLQYIMNEIGPSLSGEAVFYNTFIPDFHVRDELLPTASAELCIGLDTGRNPAAIITQTDSRGRTLVLGECAESNMGIEKFITEHLRPMLDSERYRGARVYCVIDPAGRQRSQIGEESVMQAVRRLGIPTVVAQTNAISPRLRAVEKRLQLQISGGGALLFDKTHCPQLVLAMQSQYRFKKKKSGELDNAPEKLHPWSDLADALQYACLGGTHQIRSAAMQVMGNNFTSNQASNVAVGGWT